MAKYKTNVCDIHAQQKKKNKESVQGAAAICAATAV